MRGRRMGMAGACAGQGAGMSKGGAPTPLFFVSVASKGFSHAVSLLFATLTGGTISVAAKGLTLHQNCARRGRRASASGAVRRTAWRASPGTETGMSRNCMRDAKGAQETHMVRGALS